MLMVPSVRLVTFQFMSVALRLKVKHLFSCVLMCFFFKSAFVMRLFFIIILITSAVGSGKKSLFVIQSSTAI